MKSAVVLAGLGLVLLTACNKPAPPAAEIRPVRTVVAAASTQGEEVSLTGHIRARTEESLAFRIDGRMIARRVDVGQEVRPGDLVAELDPQPQRDALRAAQAAVTAAQATLTKPPTTWNASRRWWARAGPPGSSIDAAEKTFLTAKAAVDAAAAQVHTAEDQLGYTQLLADAAGVVIAKGAEAGEVVRAGQMIVTVAQHDGADAVFDVPASLMRQVSPDAPSPSH